MTPSIHPRLDYLQNDKGWPILAQVQMPLRRGFCDQILVSAIQDENLLVFRVEGQRYLDPATQLSRQAVGIPLALSWHNGRLCTALYDMDPDLVDNPTTAREPSLVAEVYQQRAFSNADRPRHSDNPLAATKLIDFSCGKPALPVWLHATRRRLAVEVAGYGVVAVMVYDLPALAVGVFTGERLCGLQKYSEFLSPRPPVSIPAATPPEAIGIRRKHRQLELV